ncbi:helix-turn-helix transcriptional regulator [Paraconexibacter antarcticus]|uniref:Helix-turn-helix transcriptional regulator n=1 Tax=Paraconexibacter antarcticus TaxID=2949664 RepID=A0ABY5DXR7_9ACTN|nr:helix-turn-helix transcriptional regulator [Paraconexibacter antarcticus]UTI65430.1 helix-turn-helix transcriptional regulator [Paraconexibacter antarcticus]
MARDPSLGPAQAGAALDALAQLDAEIWQREASDRGDRLESLVRIHEALGRLQQCRGPAELIEAAPREVRRACGFTRVLLSRVHGLRWVPYALDEDERFADPELTRAFAAALDNADIPLADLHLETEMVRRRAPLLVSEATAPDRDNPVLRAAGCTAYVGAPVAPTHRVIALFHADFRGAGHGPTKADRDNLWAFAEHFGLLFERAVLIDRLARQREALDAAFASAARRVDEVYRVEMALTMQEPATGATAPATVSGWVRPGLSPVITAREREVLELMALGHTNVAIAQALVVSEATVKSHVKRVLRKLHVTNRAEAVARYLHFVKLEGGAP